MKKEQLELFVLFVSSSFRKNSFKITSLGNAAKHSTSSHTSITPAFRFLHPSLFLPLTYCSLFFPALALLPEIKNAAPQQLVNVVRLSYLVFLSLFSIPPSSLQKPLIFAPPTSFKVKSWNSAYEHDSLQHPAHDSRVSQKRLYFVRQNESHM